MRRVSPSAGMGRERVEYCLLHGGIGTGKGIRFIPAELLEALVIMRELGRYLDETISQRLLKPASQRLPTPFGHPKKPDDPA